MNIVSPAGIMAIRKLRECAVTQCGCDNDRKNQITKNWSSKLGNKLNLERKSDYCSTKNQCFKNSNSRLLNGKFNWLELFAFGTTQEQWETFQEYLDNII